MYSKESQEMCSMTGQTVCRGTLRLFLITFPLQYEASTTFMHDAPMERTVSTCLLKRL